MSNNLVLPCYKMNHVVLTVSMCLALSIQTSHLCLLDGTAAAAAAANSEIREGATFTL